MKKNYFYLSLVVIATTYQAFSFIFYPELVQDWLIRLFGFLFILYAIGAVLDMRKLYLQNEINRLAKEISDSLEAEKYSISEWLEKNSDLEIDKQVKLELEELFKKSNTNPT